MRENAANRRRGGAYAIDARAAAFQYHYAADTRLTLLLGILIGIYVVFEGVLVNDFFLVSWDGYHVLTRAGDDRLALLANMVLGTIWLVLWKEQDLRSRIPSLPRGADNGPSWTRVLFAFIFIGINGFGLLAESIRLPDTVEFILLVGGVIALLLSIGIILYQTFRRGDL